MASTKLFLVTLFALVALSVAATDFTGRYKMTVKDSDNYNELLKKLGIGYFKRLAATASSSEYVISKNGDTYTFNTVTTFADSSVQFKDGVEFDEPRADGQTVKSTITISGNKWTHVQKGNPTVTIERTWSEDGKVIDVVTKCEEVTVVRKYEKQ